MESNVSQQRGRAVKSDHFLGLPWAEQEALRQVLAGPPDTWTPLARACVRRGQAQWAAARR